MQDRQKNEEPDERGQDRMLGSEWKSIARIGEPERRQLDGIGRGGRVEAEAGNAERFESREGVEECGEIRKVGLVARH